MSFITLTNRGRRDTRTGSNSLRRTEQC